VLTGSYTGNGAVGRAFTTGFAPAFVIIKGDFGVGSALRTSTMAGDATKPWDPLAMATISTNHIQSFDSTGFTIGSSPRVNQSGVTYYWAAFAAVPGQFVTGTYSGDGSAGRLIRVNLQPDFVLILPEGPEEACFRFATQPGSESFQASSSTPTTTGITSFVATGFTVGPAASTNLPGETYHYVAWRQSPGAVAVQSFTGTAVARSIAVGFAPSFVLLRNGGLSATLQRSVAIPAATDLTLYTRELAGVTNRITTLEATGFRLGTDAEANGAGAVMHWLALAPNSLDAGSDGGLDAGVDGGLDAGLDGGDDAGAADAGPADAGAADAGATDAGLLDAGSGDAGGQAADGGTTSARPRSFVVGCGCQNLPQSIGALALAALTLRSYRPRPRRERGHRNPL
jgi:hypothetical protein